MIKDLRLEDGEYGQRAVITSEWSPEISRYLLANNIVELELNYAKGWRGKDLSFLKELPRLKAFKIIDWGISSVQPIHFLHELRKLEVMTYCKTAIQFSEFPHLEDCGLEWRSKSESICSCTTLKKLFVNRYKKKNVDAFSTLVNLESLAILNAPVENLLGLRSVIRLGYLRLGNLRRLASLAGIEGLAALEELNVDTCRAVGSIDEVGSLSGLRKLHLSNSGGIESLKPLEKLSGLEWVTFTESTNITDGDISPLLHHRSLSRVSFQNRRHYSHRREDFGAAYYGAELMKQIEMGAKPPSIKEMVNKAMKSSSKPLWRRTFSR
jgi:Leucine-rich repeat (LRR) protein